jgi:hypothetical protein
MNILLYVMTMLMALSLLTYARLESFRTFSGMKMQFTTYMQAIERQPINTISQEWYDRTVVNRRVSQDTRDKAPGSSRLSFYLFLNKEEREKQTEAYQQTRELAKHLMVALYGTENFFKEMLSEHPTFLDEIIMEIETLSEALPKGKKITKAAGLANLQLSNPELHRVFNRMLHGELPPVQETPKATKPLFTEVEFSFGKSGIISEASNDDDDEMDAALESEEAHSQVGIVSLIDNITVKNRKKIRVYLASRALLLAIYGDHGTVDSILETRKQMYGQLKSDGTLKDSLSQSFKERFSNMGHASSYTAILDFAVTKTEPTQYE